jgi:tRNA(fMet)-specific endonuclease VapC
MNRTLLDTDILSEILKQRDANVATNASAYLAEHGQLTLSSITVLEIVRGYRRVGRDAKVKSFERALADCEVLPFDEAAGRLAGRIYADLEKRGRPIGLPDVMIAAIALQQNVVLATGNVTHFESVREAGYSLAIENWRTLR